MSMKRVLFTLIALFFLNSPALAQEDGWTLDGVAKVESGRIFREQGFTLYDGPTIVGDLTACRGNFCADLWRAQTSETAMNETDLTVWWSVPLAEGITFQPNVAFFELPEFKDVWRGRLTLTVQTSENCNVSVNADVLRGGLDSEVLRGQFGCNHQLSEDLSLNWRAGAAYDRAFRNTSGLYHVGVSTHVGQWTGELYGEGFAGTHESDAIVGVSVARRF